MNQYHIYDQIGKGKHSVVYKGRKKKSLQYFAIKSVEKTQRQRLLQEVQTIKPLDQENILNFHAWYETSNHFWLILEYCVGGDLLTLLRQDKQIPEESIHDFARDLVNALQYLHSRGIIYCDLKPSNILLDENGRLKLCDFGLARPLGDIAQTTNQQLPQAKRGTPCYMAPELLEEGGVNSFHSDLWALGCVMYECFAGRPPFASSSFNQLVNSILTDNPPPLPGNPTWEFQDLVFKLLVKDPMQRIQWDELRNHPFWRSKFKALPLPPQPALENFLRQRPMSQIRAPAPPPKEGSGGSSGEYPGTRVALGDVRKVDKNAGEEPPQTVGSQESSKSGVRSPKNLSQNSNASANVLRLSRIVRTNLLREADGGEEYVQKVADGGSNEDITLENHDLELDFEEKKDEEGVVDEEIVREEDGGGSRGIQDSKHSRSSNEEETEQQNLLSQQNTKVENFTGELKSSPDLEYPPSSESKGAQTMEVVGETVGVIRDTPQDSSQSSKHRTHPDSSASPIPKHASTSDADRDESSSKDQDAEESASSVSHALWHPSDLAVKPIMLNRRIEKLPEPTFDNRQLPVEAIMASDLISFNQDQCELFLARIVGSLTSNSSLTEKLNVLRYLQALCTDTDAANLLINSPVVPILVKMLRTTKPPGLRVELTSLLGLLIRHATLIHDEVANSGMVSVLTDTLRDKQEKVRRRAIASLGELIFYIATQNNVNAESSGGAREPNVSSWQVPSTTIYLVASLLRTGEEEVTQHYAVKTIENVATEGGEWAARFSTHDIATNLCSIFRSSSMAGNKHEHLKLTAGSCLVRLVRSSPGLMNSVLEKITFKEMVASLVKGNSREQQIFVNLFNMALAGAGGSFTARHVASLTEDKLVISNVMSMLEHGSDVLQGKALLSAALLCRMNRRWILLLCNSKLLSVLERVIKEKDWYVQLCLEALVNTILSLALPILHQISKEIDLVSDLLRKPSNGNGPLSKAQQQLKNSVSLFPVLLHLITSPIFRSRIIDESLILQLSNLVLQLETAAFQGQEEFQTELLLAVEALSQHASLLLPLHDVLLSHMLPNLTTLFLKFSSGDVRSVSLKIFCDILFALLNPSSAKAEETGDTSLQSKINSQVKELINSQFLPHYPVLVKDEDPVPMYAQKLLATLLDHDCVRVSDLDKLGLIPTFFNFLHSDFSTVNMHVVRLCLAIVESSQVSNRTLSSLRIVSRLGALLEYSYDKAMEDFLEPILSLCRTLLRRVSESNHDASTSHDELSPSESSILDIVDFGPYSDMFLELVGSFDRVTAEIACECVMLAMLVVPRESAAGLLRNAPQFSRLLQTCSANHSGNPSLVAKLHRLLLASLAAACREQLIALSNDEPPLVNLASSGEFSSLEHVLSQLRKSGDNRVVEAAADLSVELQRLLRFP